MEHDKPKKRKLPTYVCCLCHKKFEGYGNNPAPLADHGWCCDECNKDVIVARMVEAMKDLF